MAAYLHPLPIPEAGLAALYLAGVAFPETDSRDLNVGGALLSRVLAQRSPAPASRRCVLLTCATAIWAELRRELLLAAQRDHRRRFCSPDVAEDLCRHRGR